MQYGGCSDHTETLARILTFFDVKETLNWRKIVCENSQVPVWTPVAIFHFSHIEIHSEVKYFMYENLCKRTRASNIVPGPPIAQQLFVLVLPVCQK